MENTSSLAFEYFYGDFSRLRSRLLISNSLDDFEQKIGILVVISEIHTCGSECSCEMFPEARDLYNAYARSIHLSVWWNFSRTPSFQLIWLSSFLTLTASCSQSASCSQIKFYACIYWLLPHRKLYNLKNLELYKISIFELHLLHFCRSYWVLHVIRNFMLENTYKTLDRIIYFSAIQTHINLAHI